MTEFYIRIVPSHQNELFWLYWLTSPQFHHSNHFLLLYAVALVYSMQETIAVVELWAYNPILYDASSNGMMYNTLL